MEDRQLQEEQILSERYLLPSTIKLPLKGKHPNPIHFAKRSIGFEILNSLADTFFSHGQTGNFLTFQPRPVGRFRKLYLQV